MAGFNDILGHEQIIDYFRGVLKNRQLSHAYIFNGEKGIGKHTLARAFSKAIECEAGYGDCCDMCRSCLQVESGNQPDIKWVSHEKPTSIGVDDIRNQVNNDIDIKPYSSKYKIYIIADAEKMTQQAQNAILKTIEEPPAYAMIMLLTTSLDSLLPTIRSRCMTLNLHGVNFDAIKNYLIAKCHVPDYQAKVCAAFAQGNIGRAMMMASSEHFAEMNDYLMHLLHHVNEMEVHEMIDTIKEMSAYKVEINDLIDLMMVWYRDALMLKATSNINLMVYQEDYNSLRERARKSSYEGLNNIIEGLEKAKERLAANANFDITMEMMLLTIKEN